MLAWEKPGATLALSDGILYLVGTFLITMICNVPRNDALAGLHPSAPASAQLWTEYVRVWTAWNHVRTIAASALMMLALWLSCFASLTLVRGPNAKTCFATPGPGLSSNFCFSEQTYGQLVL